MAPSTRSGLRVERYSIETLAKILGELSDNPVREVERKPHLAYFKSYFRDEGLETAPGGTVVVEAPYVDRHYLDDYAAYYLRCHKYESVCGRLHFFRSSFDLQELAKATVGQSTILNQCSLNDRYLGYVVVKPLPVRFIGRTCLKTYPSEGKGRSYPCVRHYEVHLLGFTLTVDSLAFQEQDEVTAACATSALWSAFQGTGKLFNHQIPSPARITQSVMDNWPSLGMPNRGLTIEQVAAAIRNVGLEPMIVEPKDEESLKAHIYAYLRARIPCVLWAELFDTYGRSQVPPTPPESYLGKGTTNISHAVAVTGYRDDVTQGTSYFLNNAKVDTLILRSSRIDRVFVHDDRIGPFARLILGQPAIHAGGRAAMLSSWKRRASDEIGYIHFVPTSLIIPIYPKIRIPLNSILKRVAILDTYFQEVLSSRTGRLEWDVYLCQEGEFKRDLQSMGDVPASRRVEIISRSLPRFLWRAAASDEKGPVLEYVYNATDLEDGNILVEEIERRDGILSLLRSTSRS